MRTLSPSKQIFGLRPVQGQESAVCFAARAAPGTLLLILFFLLLNAGCHSASRTPPPGEEAPTTRVIIHNHNFYDMWVYLERGSEQFRLGRISGNQTSVLVVPPELVKSAISVRFRFRPIGSAREHLSEEITLLPGDEVEIVLPVSL